jgi:Fe-S-cluster containining protein
MQCRVGCGACCIAPSISSPIPGMPEGKLAGERCVQLSPEHTCRLFGRPERPPICASLQPAADFCGGSRREALSLIAVLEWVTQ